MAQIVEVLAAFGANFLQQGEQLFGLRAAVGFEIKLVHIFRRAFVFRIEAKCALIVARTATSPSVGDIVVATYIRIKTQAR